MRSFRWTLPNATGVLKTDSGKTTWRHSETATSIRQGERDKKNLPSLDIDSILDLDISMCKPHGPWVLVTAALANWRKRKPRLSQEILSLTWCPHPRLPGCLEEDDFVAPWVFPKECLSECSAACQATTVVISWHSNSFLGIVIHFWPFLFETVYLVSIFLSLRNWMKSEMKRRSFSYHFLWCDIHQLLLMWRGPSPAEQRQPPRRRDDSMHGCLSWGWTMDVRCLGFQPRLLSQETLPGSLEFNWSPISSLVFTVSLKAAVIYSRSWQTKFFKEQSTGGLSKNFRIFHFTFR